MFVPMASMANWTEQDFTNVLSEMEKIITPYRHSQKCTEKTRLDLNKIIELAKSQTDPLFYAKLPTKLKQEIKTKNTKLRREANAMLLSCDVQGTTR